MTVWMNAGQASALGLILAGCSGNIGVASTPVPVSYTKVVDLTGDHIFQTASVSFDSKIPIVTNVTQNAYGSGITIAYNAAAGSYTLTAPDGATSSFDSSNVPNIESSDTLYFNKTTGSLYEAFQLSRPAPHGFRTSYTIVGVWLVRDTVKGTGYNHYAVGGVPTVSSDMPRSGSAFYKLDITGNGATSWAGRSIDGAGTLSVNFASAALTTSFEITSFHYGDIKSANLGTYTGTGTIAKGTSSYAGMLSGPGPSGPAGSPVTGTFSGGFFGPKAQETAFVFDLKGADFGAAGYALGIKE